MALLMLSLATTALAQTQGDENGTGQEAPPMAEADIPSSEVGDLLGDIDLGVKILGGIVGILVGLTALCTFSRRKDKRTPSDGGGHHVENSTDSPISFGDHSPAIKADRIEGGVHINYPGPKEPTRAEKPPGNIINIPHPHNSNFTGRKDLLEKLHEALAAGERAAFTQTSAITGLGGVGKTQLALEYSYRHADDYQVVWWVRSEEPATLAADYSGLAGRLDLPEKSSQDQGVIVEAVRCWLEQNGSWLLVFDNAQNFKDLEDYLPRTGSGHVIITSRNQSWGGVARMLPVDIFTPAESVEFLRRRTRQDDEDTAKALAQALGNLPLALEQAGAYIQETGITLSAYLKLFKERQKELLSRGKPDAYPDTVATTWELSFQKASEEVPASADLLNLCAFLAPDDIPKSLLTDGAEHLPEHLASAVTDEMALNDAVAALKRYSLMTVGDDSLSVHRLVQAVARDRLSDEERKRWAEAAVRLVNKVFPYESYDVRTWAKCSVLLPQALDAAGNAEGLEVAPEATSHLLNQVGIYFYGRAEFDEAKSSLERALEIKVENFGPDNPNVADLVNNLGVVLKDMGDLAGAKKNIELAIGIGERTLGRDHPDVAVRINNLGGVLRALGDLDGAKKSYERALEIDEKVYGPDHPNVATDINNLGGVLGDLGDLEGAKKSHERALSIDEKVYGPDHPEVARDANNLGGILYSLGDLESARKNLERALEICQLFLGEDHPNTIKVRENLESLRR